MTLALGLVGCGQPVREDRSITWSPDGKGVGFQHGQEGVFVADKEGGGLKKIFQPGAEVLATSTPLWAPDGKRLIFATARDPGAVQAQAPRQEQDPAGNVHCQRPVVYTCWLRGEAKGGKEPAPVKLFEAACDHVGYVAANLAVRWHPDGNGVLYLKEVGEHLHGLFHYDVRTGRSRQIFPHAAEALLFDWAPDNANLVCVLAGARSRTVDDGIWVGRPGGRDWWHVPGSEASAEPDLPSLLECLRASRPAFTADSGRFAFVSSVPPPTPDKPGYHFLRLGTLADRTVIGLAEGEEAFRDLCWSPDGGCLGMVRGRENPMLHLVRPGGELSAPLGDRPVRRFAGWSRSGEHLAYVVPGRMPLGEEEWWTFLLVPDPLAQDAVLVADGKGEMPGREVFSGMRITFPRWSPDEEKLSLWFTFGPTYRSVVSEVASAWLAPYAGLTLRRGDPAAVLDVKTGAVHWLAVNSQEKVHVGHYYLRKHDYAEAWRWYEEARRQRPGPQPAGELLAYLPQLAAPNNLAVFEYHCLAKLGRKDEARAKIEEFRQNFLRPQTGGQEEGVLALVAGVDAPTMRERIQAILDPKALSGSLLRDLSVAEVFLSVDAAADGEAFFREALDAADSDPVRLSNALVLSQFLLVQKKYPAYADLAADVIAPLLARLHTRPAEQLKDWLDPEAVQEMALLFSGALALGPLIVPDFLAELPEGQVRTLVPRWQALEANARDDFARQALDLLLHAAYGRLGMEKERQAVAERYRKEHGGEVHSLDGKEVRDAVERARKDLWTTSPSR